VLLNKQGTANDAFTDFVFRDKAYSAEILRRA
jgi:hypothetical protein